MRRFHTIAVLAVLSCLPALSAQAQVPPFINYQGRLTDTEGNPQTTLTDITFTVHSDETGVDTVWMETHLAVSVDNGLFAAILGEIEPFPEGLFDGSLRFLGVTVADGDLSNPLIPIVSVPYAVKSGGATFAEAAGFAEGADLAAMAEGVVEDAIDSTRIINGGIAMADLNPAGASNGKVLKFIDDSWAPGDDLTGSGGAAYWIVSDSVLQTLNFWGLARGATGNENLGTGTHTIVNLGIACTTGVAGSGLTHMTIGGGLGNAVVESRATVAGGFQNRAEGSEATVGGGQLNTATGAQSTVSGGQANDAQSWMTTIGGGANNIAVGDGSTIGGGQHNFARSKFSTVAGGGGETPADSNLAGYWYSTVGGGHGNAATGISSTVGGGWNNTASSDATTVAGGMNNTVSRSVSTIGGGSGNTVDAMDATIAGGNINQITGDFGFIGGGVMNEITEELGTIAGGQDNEANDTAGTVCGGVNNYARAAYSFVGGGGHVDIVDSNSVSGRAGVIVGGQRNMVAAQLGVVVGGQANTVYEEGGFVGGGWINGANKYLGVVVGGSGNNVIDSLGAIVGGWLNHASLNAFVGCGAANAAIGDYSAIPGGSDNTSSGDYSAIGGGMMNSVDAVYGSIPGGESDTLTSNASHSFAVGRGVYVNSAWRSVFYNSTHPGYLGINRDDRNGGISYPIHVGTNTSNGNGAYLSATGQWMNGSSRTFKEEFRRLSRDELLSSIDRLPVTRWRFKGTAEEHIGPVAEDFVELFGTGVVDANGITDNRYLSAGDVAGVALAGVKELMEIIEELKSRNEQLERRVTELEASR